MSSAKLKYSTALLSLVALLSLAGCGGGSESAPENAQSPAPPPTPTAPTAPSFSIGGFKTISEQEWTPVAVNKVLHTFALGGHASDAQVLAWSEQHPVTAIEQILSFDQHNLALSPPSAGQTDGMSQREGSLDALARFWSSDDAANGIPESRRSLFDYSQSGGWLEHLWPMAVTTRGLNPFLHKITYFEANQHMAVNTKSVPVTTVIRYYDDISKALTAGLSYDQVLAEAAASAAIAHQYGHRLNQFRNNECLCNEDFAREFYQLFFGITGDDARVYHETTTIKNTAMALTDIRILKDANDNFTPDVTYGSEFHPSGSLEMLGATIDGTNAKERVTALAAIAIEHPESLATLPVMLVRGLADDNLSASGEAIVREAWASMAEKDLLLFLRAYAVSELFHSEQRTKYWTSLERRLLVTNKITSSNEEIYQRVYSVVGHVFEGVNTFQPSNNVFGDQTGDMAADSLDVFLQNYNQTTDRSFVYRRYTTSSDTFSWTKDWRDNIPATNGLYPVKQVAPYLWQRFTGDGGKNYGALERAHLYALLATQGDLAAFLDPDDLTTIYSEADLAKSDIASRLDELGELSIPLNSSDAVEVEQASYRVGQAISFIVASPYMFYMEGK